MIIFTGQYFNVRLARCIIKVNVSSKVLHEKQTDLIFELLSPIKKNDEQIDKDTPDWGLRYSN